MSDHLMHLVPTDPRFRPTPEHAEHARQLLVSFVPRADEVTAAATQRVTFVDPGGNWSGVLCPACRADAEPWWSAAMEAAFAGGFRDLRCVAGCCGARVSLNELHYVWPAASGSFVLTARNPQVTGLSAEMMDQLQRLLGCELRMVRAHV